MADATTDLLRVPLSRRRLLLLAGSAALAAALPAPGRDVVLAQTADERVVRRVLPNGLTVLVDERRTADTIAVELSNRDGARNDADLPGISVLTSRMMFQGTTRRPSETDLQRAAAAVGGTLTRGTGTELSSYTSVVPSREAQTAFDLIADVVINPLLSPEALDRQQQIALQEIAQRRAQPSSYIDELFQTTLFAGHPAGIPVLGTPESVSSITPDAVREWRAAMWTAPNLVLTVVGRIRAEDALAEAERFFAGLPAGEARPHVALPPVPPEAPRLVTATAGQQQVLFRVGFIAPSLLDADRYPMTVLNAIMTGTAGRLYRQLRSARGLAYVAGSGYTPISDAGSWFATAGVDPQNVDEAIEIVREEIARMRAEPPSTEETANRQNQIAGRQILADETNAARASRLASRHLLGTEPTEEYVRRIRAVTPADVQRVAQTYLDPEWALVVIVGPEMPAGVATP